MLDKSLDITSYIGRHENAYGLVLEENEQDKGYSYRIKLSMCEEKEGLLFSENQLQVGHYYYFTGRIEPLKEALNTGSFSEAIFLKSKGITYRFKGEKLELTDGENYLLIALNTYKKSFDDKINQVLSKEDKYLFYSFFLGDKSHLDAEISKRWQDLGISHLLAVSGTHVNILLDVLVLISIFIPIGKKRWWIIWFLFTIYFLLAFSPSILRCYLFFIIRRLSSFFKWPIKSKVLLFLTAAIMIFYQPYLIYNISFQFSVILVYGLYHFKFLFKGFFLKKAFFLGFIAYLFSFPLLLYYFQKASLMSIFLTPILMPLLQILLIFGALILFIPFNQGLLGIFSQPLYYSLRGMIKLTEVFDSFPSLVQIGSRPDIYIILIYFFLLILMGIFLQRKKMKVFFSLSVCFVVLLFTLIGSKSSPFTEVHWINVDQGDCVFIRRKGGKGGILIDGGRKNDYVDYGKKEVIPYLKRLGVFHLDLVISTHGDEDHLGGLQSVLKSMEVDKVWIPYLKYDTKGDYKWMIRDYESLIEEVGLGKVFKFGEWKGMVENPSMNVFNPNPNKCSLAISFEANDMSLFLGGDVEIDVVEQLILKGKKYQYFMAPHHGSKYSFKPGMYSALGCKNVICSVGKNNTYGHPNQDLILDLEKEKIPFYRTDFHGSIVLYEDNGFKITSTYE